MTENLLCSISNVEFLLLLCFSIASWALTKLDLRLLDSLVLLVFSGNLACNITWLISNLYFKKT